MLRGKHYGRYLGMEVDLFYHFQLMNPNILDKNVEIVYH
jgi:hypothetical protein